MEQLSSLDAQFLGVESARTYGHVGMLAVYDPSTAPGERLEAADLCRLIAGRIHLLPPLRRRLVDIPLGLDLPVIVDGVGLNITVLSYLDQIDVGIVADREQMDDLWSLLAAMERALDELEGAVAAAA